MKHRTTLQVVAGTGAAAVHPPLSELRERIVEAAAVAWAAEGAYRNREPQSIYLHSAADRAHRELLARIVELTSAEADQVEPAFTAFEDTLLQLPALGTMPGS